MTEFHTLNDVAEVVLREGTRKRLAVAAAEDSHTLEAVLKAYDKGFVTPVLTGNRERIIETLKQFGRNAEAFPIHHADDPDEAASTAVQLVREGHADFIMKGLLESSNMLRPVVNRETGLGKGGTISHLAFLEIPNYHKLLVLTDVMILIKPDLDQKKLLIQNAVGVLRKMGYECPKVAVLAAIETVNLKMPETVDAAALKEMNRRGEIQGCIVEGPISVDLALSREVATIKGYQSEVTGDPDVFLVPDIASGNILLKSLIQLCGARAVGFAVGAKVPVVLTSRGTPTEEKYMSILLSAAAI